MPARQDGHYEFEDGLPFGSGGASIHLAATENTGPAALAGPETRKASTTCQEK